MRRVLSRIRVSSEAQTVAAHRDGAYLLVCGALVLALALLIFRIVGQL
jgi:hypothetical protein